MVDEVMKFITEADPEVGEAIEAEAARQRRNLELIASENRDRESEKTVCL